MTFKESYDQHGYYENNKYFVAESLFNEKFAGHDLSKLELSDIYKIFKTSYEKETGKSWNEEKFMKRVQNWDLFGDQDGFVAARKQKGGLYKLVGVAGNKLSILRGFNELLQTGDPVWGLVSKEIQELLNKKGFKTPSPMVAKAIAKRIPSSVLGGADFEMNKDGSITIDYPDIGKATKFFVANKQYYKWAIENMGDKLPTVVKWGLKLLLEDVRFKELN